MLSHIVCQLLLLGAIAAQPPAEAATGPTFRGTVRYLGRPAPRSEVWLIGDSDKDWQPELAATRADDQGRFTLPLKTDARWVVARDAGGRLGWLAVSPSWEELTWEPALRVDLHETADARGKLLGPDGEPLRGRIRIITLSLPGESRDQPSDYLAPPVALAGALEVALADDGRFVIRGVPVGSTLRATVKAAGYGDLSIGWDQGRPLELRLEKPGAVRLHFTGAPDPKLLVGLTLDLSRKTGPDQDTPDTVWFGKRVKAGPDSTLRVDGVYPGPSELRPEQVSTAPLAAQARATFEVKPGEETEVTVAVKPRARVQGQVIDGATGKGIPGVGVSITSPGERGTVIFRGSTETDAAGRFRAYVEPGKLSLSVYRPPAGYLRPDKPFPETHTVAAGDSATFALLAFEPAVPVEGVVQDAEGRPVPWVRVVAAHATLPDAEPVRTDAAGRFTLRDLGPKDVTALRARTATAVTDGAVPLDVARQKGPVKLVLSEAHAFRLRGRVLDDTGRPVADAAVRVEWRYQGVGRSGRYGLGAWLGTYRTDAEGHFETQALWPGDGYKVEVMAPGYGRAESAEMTGDAGKQHDLGTIALPRTSGHVAGVVLDGAGRPVAGAQVFNQGDAPARQETTTDAAGRFKLQGLYDGPAYVFVRQPGYRFTMARARSGDESVTVRLLKAGEAAPAAEQLDPRPPAYLAAEQRLTRHLLDRLWALPRSVTDGYERTVLEAMAGIDLAQAKKWLAEEAKRSPAAAGANSRMGRIVRMAEAEKAAADDPDEALTLLAPLPSQDAFDALLRLAERSEKDDPAKALRSVQEAVVKARALPLPDRARALAQAGDWAVRLGQGNSGRKLLTEAADLADHFGTDQTQGWARISVAKLLAPYDLARSRTLIKGIREATTWNFALADMAVRRASTDPREALAMLDEFRPDNSFVRDETRLRIAYRLAEKDPAGAVKQAQAIADAHYRATALSGVAVLIARRDPERARALIDRVLDMYLDQHEQFMGWSNFGGQTTFAARTAYDARLAGYPDLAGVVARVLATRPTTSQGNSPGEVAETLLRTAISLSLTDPVTARRLVEQALPNDRPIPAHRRGRRETLFAVALADPERAVGLVDELIDQAQKSKDGLRGTDLTELLLTLAAPTERLRVRELDKWIDHSWSPGSED